VILHFHEHDNLPDADDWPQSSFEPLKSSVSQMANLARLQYRWRVRGLAWGAAAGVVIPGTIDMWCNCTVKPLHIVPPDPTLVFVGLIGGALVGYTIAGFLLVFAKGMASNMGRNK
jgi:hypothetical protein